MIPDNHFYLKFLTVREFLIRNSDEEHPVTTTQIVAYLNSQGLDGDRKTVYRCLKTLSSLGENIISVGAARRTAYFIEPGPFQFAELRLLAESVGVSRLFTQGKTNELIDKLCSFCSRYQAEELHEIAGSRRVKSSNPYFYYSVQAIDDAIRRKQKVSFQYFNYDMHKEMVLRKGGARYEVSPFALTYSGERYYMVAYDSEAGIIKHYRVDRMQHTEVVDARREGEEVWNSRDIGTYSRKIFGMFSGTETSVTMRFSSHLVGSVLDQLGWDINVEPEGEESFTVTAPIIVSPQFYGWIAAFGRDAKILGPKSVVDGMTAHVRSIAELYGIVRKKQTPPAPPAGEIPESDSPPDPVLALESEPPAPEETPPEPEPPKPAPKRRRASSKSK